MLRNPLTLDRYVQASAARVNMAVRYIDSGPPQTDGETIYLPTLDPLDATRKAEDRLRYWVAHEVSHVLYSDFEPLQDGRMIVGADSLLGTIMNVIEDARVDLKNRAVYPGDAEAMDRFYIDEVTDLHEAVSAGKVCDRTPDRDIKAALRQWQEDLVGTDAMRAASVSLDLPTDDAALKSMRRFTEYVTTDLPAITDNKAGTQAAWDVACQIFEALGGDVEMELERIRKERASAKDAADKVGAGKDDAISEAEGDDTSEAEDEGKEGDWTEFITGAMSGTLSSAEKRDAKGHEHVVREGTGDLVSESTGDVGAMHSRLSRVRSGPWIPTSPRGYHVVDYRRDVKPPLWDRIVSSGVMRSLPHQYASDAFAQQLRQRLQIQTRTMYEYGKREGKLNPRALHRLAAQDAPPSYSESVFKKKRRNLDLDVSVSIVLDCSGSMRVGGRFDHAAQSLMLLNQALGNVLHVPIELVGFTDAADPWHTVDSNVLLVFREFDQVHLPENTLKTYLQDAASHLWDNADGEAIQWAWHRLVQQRTRKKVMIVLSDGLPETCRSGDIRAYTKRVIDEIYRDGRVELYAIGIQTRHVRTLYRNSDVIHEASQLERTLLDVIDRAIFRGV